MARVCRGMVAALFVAGFCGADQSTAQPPRVLPPTRSVAAPAPAPPPQQPPKSTATNPPAPKSKTSAKPRLTDSQLEAAIRAKFAKSKLAGEKLTVHVQGGVATIDGKTDVVQHKGNATRMAKTAGAIAVNNRVEVSEAAKEKAAGNLEKGRRRVQVKRGDARSDARSDGQPSTQTPAQKKN